MTRKLLRSSAVLAVAVAALASAPPATAQVVVVTVKSAGGVLDDVRYLVGAVAPQEQAKPLLDMLDRFKDPATLKGLDLKRPLGALVDLPKDPNAPPTPSVVVFVPVTDGKAFLATLQQQGFAVDANAGAAAPGFSHKVTPPGGNAPPLFTVLTPAYAYFSMAPTGAPGLQKLNPAGLLPRRADAGTISVSARLDRVSAQLKEMAIAQLAQGAAKQAERKEGEADAQYQGRLAGSKFAQEAMTSLIREGKELTVDLGIDSKKAEVAFEFGLSANPGTPTAAALKRFGGRQSLFRGIGKGAALQAWADMAMSQSLRTAMTSALEQGRKEAEKKADAAEKQLAADLLDALKPTLAGDEADLGMAIHGPFPKAGHDPTFVVLAGAKLKGGKKVEKVFRDSVVKGKAKDEYQVKLDVAKAADGTAIGRMKAKPKEGQKADSLGEPLMFFAFREDLALFALGENGQKVLIQALGSTGKLPAATAAPVELAASVAKLAQMAEGTARDPLRNAAGEVFQGKDAAKDAIRLNVRGVGEAVRLRLATDVPTLRFFVKIREARQQAVPAAAAAR